MDTNDIANNLMDGILITEYAAAGNELHNSSITGNATGILNNDVDDVFNAELNWWGNGSGPYNATSNPAGTGDPVSDNVDYDPWIGKAETIDCTDPGTNYDFSNSGVILNFSSLPSGGGEVTIQRFPEEPSGYPAPPAGAAFIPLWLDISSTEIADYTFNVTVTVDVSGIDGFSSSSQVMYYNSATSSWVAVGGTYDALNETFTFTINHFTPYSFVNTPATAYDIYVCQTPGSPVTSQIIYPSDDAGTYGSGDWAWDEQAFSVYIIPESGSEFAGADIVIQWDKDKIDLQSVVDGNIWPGSHTFYTEPSSWPADENSVEIHCTNLAAPPANVVGDDSKYLAKLNFSIDKPGFSQIDMTALDFRDKDNLGVYVTANNAVCRMYLGDVYGTDGTMGDGEVDFDDLNPFSTAYWSTTTGWDGTGMEWLPSGTLYKRKFDFGPTGAPGYVYTQPIPDNHIEFEDLMIFSISYGLSQGGIYPKLPVQSEPVIVDAQLPGAATVAGQEVTIPVSVSQVVDLRGFSLRFSLDDYEYVGIEKGELTSGIKDYPVFLKGKQVGSEVWIDGAIVGHEAPGIGGEGDLFKLRLSSTSNGHGQIRLSGTDLRNSQNSRMESRIGEGLLNGLVPSEFALSQNYPNPFNPTTLIKYQLPENAKVSLTIYNSLGQVVRNLVDADKEAGYYEATWDGRNGNGVQVTSGIYFYRIDAGSFTQTRKMILMK
jgi:hypothetical protein